MNAEYEVELLEPARNFLYRLKPKMQNKALRAVALLERFGFRLTEPDTKTFQNADGLKELRIQFASDICRLFYFHHRGKLYVVTSGYIKKEQKTKRSEIERALKIMRQYIHERGNHD
jgi:phage-related protein